MVVDIVAISFILLLGRIIMTSLRNTSSILSISIGGFFFSDDSFAIEEVFQ